MSTLDINFVRLDESVRQMRDLVTDFEGVNASTEEAAEYVGHNGLAHEVRRFSDGWNSRRGKLIREMNNLADAFEAIADTFLTLDQRLAKEADDAAASLAAAASSPGGPGRGRGSSDS